MGKLEGWLVGGSVGLGERVGDREERTGGDGDERGRWGYSYSITHNTRHSRQSSYEWHMPNVSATPQKPTRVISS